MASIESTKSRATRTVRNIATIEIGSISLPRILGVLTAFLTWVFVATIFPMNLFPYPHEALLITADIIASGIAWRHLWDTIARTFWGFMGAMLLGIVIGVPMGLNNYSRKFSLPYIVVGLSVPGIAWAAITTLVFGLNITAPVTAVILTTFPYIAINVWKGVEAIEADLVKMCQSFNVPYVRMLFRLILPSAAPALFTAFRFGLAISWKVETNAEVFAASSGIGFKTIQAYESFNFASAWGWAILFIIVILVVEYAVFRPLERRVYRYRPDAELSLI